jgi:hypothetical protein
LIIFVIGKYSLKEKEFDPVYENRALSEWTYALAKSGFNVNYDPAFDDFQKNAGEVLKRNHEALAQVLIGWLDDRDTFPQLVYFFTMSRLDRVDGRYLWSDLGARSRQLKAAEIVLLLDTGDPAIIAALERNLDFYSDEEKKFMKGTDHLTEISQKAIRKQYRLLGYRFE